MFLLLALRLLFYHIYKWFLRLTTKSHARESISRRLTCLEDFIFYLGEHCDEKKKFPDRTDYWSVENNFAPTFKIGKSIRQTTKVIKPIKRSLALIESEFFESRITVRRCINGMNWSHRSSKGTQSNASYQAFFLLSFQEKERSTATANRRHFIRRDEAKDMKVSRDRQTDDR